MYFSKDIEVWTSTDGNNYTKSGSGTLPNTANTSIVINLGGIVAGKVKLVITNGYRSDYWKLGEFEVYGALALTSTENFQNVPSEFVLKQNYPNPFNPSTTIIYQLPKASMVSLQIFDIQGRLVTTIINEQKSAGQYSVQFNDPSLSSGVYYYKLTAADYSAVRKMLLIR